MDLALATGHGPALLTNLEGRGPLVRVEDTVAFGVRDGDEQRQYSSQPLPPAILALELATVRAMGIDRAVTVALDRVAAPALDGFFIHLDADCLDDSIMPAVDYRLAGGLSSDEVAPILQSAIARGRVAGLEVTIYNPALDADGSAGRDLTDMLVRALATDS